jgi:putative transferase (TIGR04331 family)
MIIALEGGVKQPKLLVLTAMQEIQKRNERIIYLGEWCNRYNQADANSLQAHEILKFHWDDREKLKRDYDYLERLHQSLLGSLTRCLNKLHHVEYPKRYWQILLDPWLFSYISVLFDRWETLKAAFNSEESYKIFFFEASGQNFPPYSYEDFIENAACNDLWNQHQYQKIINFEFSKNCTVEELRGVDVFHQAQNSFSAPPKFGTLKKIAYRSLLLLGNYFQSREVFFIGSGLSWLSALRLSIKFRKFLFADVLFRYRATSKNISVGLPFFESSKRGSVKIEFNSSSRFEDFLLQSIAYDLPCCLIEDYKLHIETINRIKFKPKLIFTAFSHFNDYLAKFWIARNILNGVKLYILEHGGALPPYRYCFNFEEDISDFRINWFLPDHVKHIQLPPAKFLDRTPKIIFYLQRLIYRRDFCTLIANECHVWVVRAHFYPMVNQWTTSFKMSVDLFNALSSEVRAKFRVRPYPASGGWNSAKKFANVFGIGKMSTHKSIKKAFLSSKIILCTYPETTFSDAMASGVPVVLFYPHHLYELNPIALPLLELLKSAKIIFHEPVEAANHINEIWSDPYEWWNSSEVINARNEFYHQALNIKSTGLGQWLKLLNDQL